MDRKGAWEHNVASMVVAAAALVVATLAGEWTYVWILLIVLALARLAKVIDDRRGR